MIIDKVEVEYGNSNKGNTIWYIWIRPEFTVQIKCDLHRISTELELDSPILSTVLSRYNLFLSKTLYLLFLRDAVHNILMDVPDHISEEDSDTEK